MRERERDVRERQQRVLRSRVEWRSGKRDDEGDARRTTQAAARMDGITRSGRPSSLSLHVSHSLSVYVARLYEVRRQQGIRIRGRPKQHKPRPLSSDRLLMHIPTAFFTLCPCSPPATASSSPPFSILVNNDGRGNGVLLIATCSGSARTCRLSFSCATRTPGRPRH